MAEATTGSEPAKMPYVPPITDRQTGPATYWTAGLFVAAALALFLYMKLLKKRQREYHFTPLEELRSTGPTEDSQFLDMQTAASDAPGTKGLATGQRLTATFCSQDKTFNSTVINNNAESFVITLPRNSEEDFTPETDDEVKIFAVREGRHLSFETTVEQVFSGGLRACSLRHTVDVSASNRRRDTRVSASGPALFTFIPERLIEGNKIPLMDLQANIMCEIPAKIQNISHGGCALRTRSPLPLNPSDLVYINACLPDSESEITCLGYIIAARGVPREKGGGSVFSVEFLAPGDEMLKLIDEHVFMRLDDEVIE